MAPRNAETVSYQNSEDDALQRVEPVITENEPKEGAPPRKLVWSNIVRIGLLHLGAIYGAYLTPGAHYGTWVFSE